jgi:glucokinase
MAAILPDAPRLLADIGATYARFGIERSPGVHEEVRVLRCADHAGFVDVMRAYLDTLDGTRPQHAAVAIANPVEDDAVRMTNRDWAFSIREAQQALGLGTLLVINNFTALAMALPRLAPNERRSVGSGRAQPHGAIGLIGPGTGLGVSGLVPHGDQWATLATEGGHVGFAPSDERELRVLQHAWRTLPRVSAERLISGPGLEIIHEALGASRDRGALDPLPTAEILRRAMADEDALCAETVDVFCGMLGSMASDLALTLGATGGIYVGGGIVPRLGDRFDRSPFRARFESKGRFSAYVARIPTFVITHETAVFHGLSSLLRDHAPFATDGTSNPLLDRIRAARDGLSPAERRVADHVLINPRAILNDAIGVIALAAGVSQPTVIRFCRSLGLQGLAEFKLKLASGLTTGVPLQHNPVNRQDGTADLSAKVLDNTISAIVDLRESLSAESIEQAIGLLVQARRIELFALGNSAVVAFDAQHKLMRLRMPSAVHTDAGTTALAAEMLQVGSLAVFISSSGAMPELLRAADIAAQRQVPVLSITARQSPLARRSTATIAVDHGEDATQFVAMVSRILHLLAMDILTVGLAVRRPVALPVHPADDSAPRSAGAEGQVRPAAGVLISHVG